MQKPYFGQNLKFLSADKVKVTKSNQLFTALPAMYQCSSGSVVVVDCLLLLPLWESVIVLCFVVHYFMSILVLQSS